MNWEKDKEQQKKPLLFCMTLLAAALDYVWGFLYYRWLFQHGELIAVKELHLGDIPEALVQHVVVNVPILCMTGIAALVWKGQFPEVFGWKMGDKKKRSGVLIVGGIFILLLIAALMKEANTPVNLLYQWLYYFLFIALAEEAEFRGLLPVLMEKSGFPEWCVWVIPGVLFGLMHTLIPAVKGTLTIVVVFSNIGGFLVSHCLFYALRKGTGSLWIPVLVHAALDFTGVFYG